MSPNGESSLAENGVIIAGDRYRPEWSSVHRRRSRAEESGKGRECDWSAAVSLDFHRKGRS